MYLRDRQPIVLNYNPFISYVDDPKTAYNDQVIRAANFMISAIRCFFFTCQMDYSLVQYI